MLYTLNAVLFDISFIVIVYNNLQLNVLILINIFVNYYSDILLSALFDLYPCFLQSK